MDESSDMAGKGGFRLGAFRFDGDDIAGDIRDAYGYDGDLVGIYTGIEGALIHKWHHYIPIYDRYFARFRGQPVRMLEIGVSRVGSLQMWRKYFGPEAVIFGVDIDPDCARFDGQDGAVRIGSQDDPEFLGSVVDEMGGVDIVLDDGSHVMDHIRTSLAALYPRLSSGGIYMIEDLHTAYVRRYGGGMGKRNFFFDLMPMIHDMHRWYHAGGEGSVLGGRIAGIHVHDSIVVLEKADPQTPRHSQVGA